MYILAGLLALGLLCNLLIRPVASQHYMTPRQPGVGAGGRKTASTLLTATSGADTRGWHVAAAWMAVGVPIAWGVWVTLQKAVVLFGS
jgi:hypothetical protein